MLFSWIHLQRVVKIDVEAIAADCEMARCVCTAKMVKGKAGRKRAALWGSSQRPPPLTPYGKNRKEYRQFVRSTSVQGKVAKESNVKLPILRNDENYWLMFCNFMT